MKATVFALAAVMFAMAAQASEPRVSKEVFSTSGPSASDPIPVVSDRTRFESLTDAANFYSEVDRQGDWSPISPGPLLRHGDSHPQIPRLRFLLRLFGDLGREVGEPQTPTLFDSDLHRAVIRFQQRHGAKVDGILGPQTRSILNVSPRRRAAQLILNSQRQRAMKAQAEERYIQVNIPEFRLRLVDRGDIILEMKTIIGRSERETPVLKSHIRTLVVNPSWNVPKGIAYKDILPGWQQDRDYLDKHHLKVVAGWETPARLVPLEEVEPSHFYRGSEYLRFWQPPGEHNALGRVKFLFPNEHSVYLHDTPQRKLFDEPMRALSSGCIRVEKPQLLADTLLQRTGLDQPFVERLIARKDTRQIRLKEPVPIYLTYWTAWLDRGNVLHFGDDIYRMDRPEQALQEL